MKKREINYIKEIEEEINKLYKHKEIFLLIAKNVLNVQGGELYSEDMLLCTSVNRSIALLNGFLHMIKNNNYLCAAPMIRMQIDGMLRFFAITLVKNSNDFFLYFISGKKIGSYRDRDNKPLQDFYLVKKLNDIYPGVSKIYKEACGYVHLSENHFFAMKDNSNCNDRKFAFRVGDYDLFDEIFKYKTIRAMREISDLFIVVAEEWYIEKKNLSISK